MECSNLQMRGMDTWEDKKEKDGSNGDVNLEENDKNKLDGKKK